jgi:hypothetical protein
MRAWFAWLFDRGDIDDNALACFSAPKLVAGSDTGLLLKNNLQRSIAQFLSEQNFLGRMTRASYDCVLSNFNIFLNQRDGAQGPSRPVIDQALIINWLKKRWNPSRPAATWNAVRLVTSFLDWVVRRGRLQENSLTSWLELYPARSRQHVLAAVLNGEPAPAVPPRFVSSFASSLEAHIDLMRAMGRRYEGAEERLRMFDRFLARGSVTRISANVITRWLESRQHIAPRTRASRLTAVRMFCRYLARSDPQIYVPGRTWRPRPRLPDSSPRVLSVSFRQECGTCTLAIV